VSVLEPNVRYMQNCGSKLADPITVLLTQPNLSHMAGMSVAGVRGCGWVGVRVTDLPHCTQVLLEHYSIVHTVYDCTATSIEHAVSVGIT
jgi:hypothetical protein